MFSEVTSSRNKRLPFMTLPSRAEFERRIRICRRRQLRAVSVLAVPIVVLIGGIVVGRYFPMQLPRWTDGMWVVPGLLTAIPAINSWGRRSKRALLSSGLFCEHCKHWMLGDDEGAALLRTGTCPTCKEQVMAA